MWDALKERMKYQIKKEFNKNHGNLIQTIRQHLAATKIKPNKYRLNKGTYGINARSYL